MDQETVRRAWDGRHGSNHVGVGGKLVPTNEGADERRTVRGTVTGVDFVDTDTGLRGAVSGEVRDTRRENTIDEVERANVGETSPGRSSGDSVVLGDKDLLLLLLVIVHVGVVTV